MKLTDNQHSHENNSPALDVPVRNLPEQGPRDNAISERTEDPEDNTVAFYRQPIYEAKKYLLF